MPELRKDPIVGRWVIISTDRAKRPTDFVREAMKIKGGFCPFCYGNENKTPPEILAYRPSTNGATSAERQSRLDDSRRPQQVSGTRHRRQPRPSRPKACSTR